MIKRLAIALALAVSASTAQAQQPPADPTPTEVYEDFFDAYDYGYALFGVKRVNWEALRRTYRPSVDDTMDDAALFSLLASILDHLNDVHVTIEDPRNDRFSRSGGRSLGTGPLDIGVFSREVIGRYYAIGEFETHDAGFVSAWLPGQTGYVHWRNFRDQTASESAIDTILAKFADAKAIVVDIRQNTGGNDRIGQAIASRFADRRRLYMTVALRKFDEPSGSFEEPVEWFITPEGSRQFTGPVALLINSRSISAAENFALAMRTLPHVTVIGETTAGAMADVAKPALINGWTVGIPVNVMRDPEGRSWEGVGIPPDLWVTNAPEEVAAGRDRVLETAIAYLGNSSAASEARSNSLINVPGQAEAATE